MSLHSLSTVVLVYALPVHNAVPYAVTIIHSFCQHSLFIFWRTWYSQLHRF